MECVLSTLKATLSFSMASLKLCHLARLHHLILVQATQSFTKSFSAISLIVHQEDDLQGSDGEHIMVLSQGIPVTLHLPDRHPRENNGIDGDTGHQIATRRWQCEQTPQTWAKCAIETSSRPGLLLQSGIQYESEQARVHITWCLESKSTNPTHNKRCMFQDVKEVETACNLIRLPDTPELTKQRLSHKLPAAGRSPCGASIRLAFPWLSLVPCTRISGLSFVG